MHIRKNMKNTPATKKCTKNNHVNLCSTRDPIHTHTVMNRFRAIASPPRGHRRQAQRSCPLFGKSPRREYLTSFFARPRGFVFLVVRHIFQFLRIGTIFYGRECLRQIKIKVMEEDNTGSWTNVAIRYKQVTTIAGMSQAYFSDLGVPTFQNESR